MRFHAIILFLCALSFCKINSQNKKFEHYNDNDGLSHNSVRHIVQDKHGFLWLGTFAGLNRFDGYQFKSYTSSSIGKDKIYNDDITALVLDDSSNNLWIGTRKGLTLFKTDTQTFKTYLSDKNNPKSLPDEEVRSIHVDRFKRVWVGTKTKGVFVLYPNENRFEKVFIEGFNYIKAIYEDQSGHIWIGSYGTASVAKITLENHGGISKIDTFTLAIPNSEEINPYINFIYEDVKADIFVGSRSGLYKFDKRTNSFVNQYIKEDDIRGKLGPYFLSVARAPDGKYWVGTLGGLLVCETLEDIATGDYQRHYAILSDDTSLVDNLISALYFDASGVLWIGTEDGLDKYDPFENQFKLSKDISGYINNQVPTIRGFSKTFDGKIIVATKHNGLFISNDNKFKPLFKGQKDIASIYSNDGTIFYCGLWNGKLMQYDYLKNQSIIVDLGFEMSPIVAFSTIDDHAIMVGSFGEGAVIMNSHNMKVQQEVGVLLPDYQINRIVKDSGDIVWFATETGVVNYNLSNQDVKIYSGSDSLSNGLPHDNVSDILINDTKEIWVATRKGLALYDANKDDFIALKEPAELVDKWVTDLACDQSGNLWLNLNNNSVARLNNELQDVNIYHVNSGNRLDVFSSSGFYNFNDNHIYLGGKNGVIYYSPNSIKENNWSPKPFISEFKIQNKEVFPGLEFNGQIPLKKDLNQIKEIALSYKNRNFSLQFSSSSFSNEKLNKYEYMLDGFDDDWIPASSNTRTVQYTNLFPSQYIFKVKSSNSDGHWSEVASYKIKIDSPFWLTLPAIVFFLLMTSIIVYLIRREIQNRLKLKQELITEKVNRERDIKLNNEKLRFFTNISHELRTPLTLILGPAKQLLESEKDMGTEYQRSRYHLIHQNASRLFNLVNQVLDFRKAQTGELKLKVSETDVLQYSQNIFESFKEFAFNKKINLTFDHEDVTIIGLIDKDKYDKILYNLLSNAIKFTNMYGNVGLFVHVKDATGNYLVIEVSDDGIGIPLKSQDKIFKRFYQATNSKENNTGSGIGLSLVKSLVTLHKGTIKVKSAPNKGSVFTIEIPIEKEFYNETEVFEFVAKQTANESLKIKTPKKIIQNTDLKEKIVVIEDNLELRKFLIDYLSDYYKVYDAENGQEGLKLCRQIKPILCVADVMMPVMDGLEFCKELKNDEFISHIPVILLTALSENEDKVKGYNLGADGYLVKPFDPALLKTVISNVIKTRLDLKTKFSGEVETEVGLLTHSPIDEKFMSDLTELIETNLSEVDLSTSFLCQELGMSSSKLYRKIKELTDLAPNEFIRTIRLKKSAVLLKSMKYNVSEVTTLIGFKDPLYFSRCFKKQFGFPPSKLLK